MTDLVSVYYHGSVDINFETIEHLMINKKEKYRRAKEHTRVATVYDDRVYIM